MMDLLRFISNNRRSRGAPQRTKVTGDPPRARSAARGASVLTAGLGLGWHMGATKNQTGEKSNEDDTETLHRNEASSKARRGPSAPQHVHLRAHVPKVINCGEGKKRD